MTKNKSINHEEQEAGSIDPERDVRRGLHVIPSSNSGIKISLPVDESLRELLGSLKRPQKDQRQSPNNDLPPAA